MKATWSFLPVTAAIICRNLTAPLYTITPRLGNSLLLSSPAMFERTLQDLIRGLRSHKASSKAQEDAFLAEAMLEIREELKGKDMTLKGEGVLKMCYVGLTHLSRFHVTDDTFIAYDVVSDPCSAGIRVSCGRGDELAAISFEA